MVSLMSQNTAGWVVHPLHLLQVLSPLPLFDEYLPIFLPHQCRILQDELTWVVRQRTLLGSGESDLE